MTRLAVFDCDGTLVDSQRRIVGAAEAAWRDQGLAPPAAADVRMTVGLALPVAIGRLAPHDADPALVAALTAGFRAAFKQLSADPAYEEPLYPGAIDALETLQAAGVLLAVATGKGRRGLAMTLERHGIEDRFIVTKTADDGPSKPAPNILLDAMAEADVKPGATVVLGDTSYDMAMARAAGAHAIGVAWGYHEPPVLEAHGAVQVLADYGQAAPAVLQLLGAGH